jgi:hypothetical protein
MNELKKVQPLPYIYEFIDEDGNVAYKHEINLEHAQKIDDVNPPSVLKDFNLAKLKKKYQRPYYSPLPDSWKMDYVIIPYNPFYNPHKYYKKFKGNTAYYYLFLINLNTKYLVVSSNFHKDADHVVKVLKDLKSEYNINSIRGDYDKAFVGKKVINYLKKKRIEYFFSPYEYTNRNRVVDRVIRTIRDKIDRLGPNASFYDFELVRDVVDVYNHTTHSAFENKFTPAQAQYNQEIEDWYIQKQFEKLSKIDHSPFMDYQLNDYLLVHVPYKLINYKRRRNFNELALFNQYINGNVEVMLLKPPKYDLIVLPIYYTKKICSRYQDLPKVIKDYFNFYPKH